jgi:hypothetical protein
MHHPIRPAKSVPRIFKYTKKKNADEKFRSVKTSILSKKFLGGNYFPVMGAKSLEHHIFATSTALSSFVL